MGDQTSGTLERPTSKAKSEIIIESKRLEESLLYSSKGHFVAAHFWRKFHLCVGIPMVIIAAATGVTAFSKFDPDGIVAGLLSILLAALSALITFLNPNEKVSGHFNAGNSYESLRSQVRLFWAIEAWTDPSDTLLTERLKNLSERKDNLNRTCPQISRRAYNTGKKGIEAGEADYLVDKKETVVDPKLPPHQP